VFAVPGVGGNVLGYSDLAKLMGPDQPFYALQSRGLDGSEEPFTRIEHIAAHFLQEMRRVQPDGPYYLLGACMGGVVAYETAQQIRAAGQEVGLLALLETWPPVNAPGRFLTPGGRAFLNLAMDRVRLTMRMLSELRGRRRLQYLLDRMKVVGQMVARRDAFRGDRSELYLRLVTQANLLALQQYEPRMYPGRAVLFRAEGRVVAVTDDRRLAWRQLTTGGLEVYTVPGDDSGTMLEEPHVRVVASHLKEHLERAQASPVRFGNA
jgi:aspartate racemase